MRLRLLDLTNGNRLLSFRHVRKSSLRVVDELPNQLFTQLVDGKELFFKPTARQRHDDQNGSAPSDNSFELPLPVPEEDGVPRRHADRAIQTLHQPEELENILRNIGSAARLAIEET